MAGVTIVGDVFGQHIACVVALANKVTNITNNIHFNYMEKGYLSFYPRIKTILNPLVLHLIY